MFSSSRARFTLRGWADGTASRKKRKARKFCTAIWETAASRSATRRDVLEAAVSQIAVQNFLAFLFFRLAVPSAQPRRVNRARDDENIELTVVIKVEKSSAPLHGRSLST